MKFELLMLCRVSQAVWNDLMTTLAGPALSNPMRRPVIVPFQPRQAIDGDHGPRLDHVGVEFPAAAAHGHVRVRLPAARRRREVGAPLRDELRLVLRRPLHVAVGAFQAGGPPVQPQPGRDPRVDREGRRLGDWPAVRSARSPSPSRRPAGRWRRVSVQPSGVAGGAS